MSLKKKHDQLKVFFELFHDLCFCFPQGTTAIQTQAQIVHQTRSPSTTFTVSSLNFSNMFITGITGPQILKHVQVQVLSVMTAKWVLHSSGGIGCGMTESLMAAYWVKILWWEHDMLDSFKIDRGCEIMGYGLYMENCDSKHATSGELFSLWQDTGILLM